LFVVPGIVLLAVGAYFYHEYCGNPNFTTNVKEYNAICHGHFKQQLQWEYSRTIENKPRNKFIIDEHDLFPLGISNPPYDAYLFNNHKDEMLHVYVTNKRDCTNGCYFGFSFDNFCYSITNTSDIWTNDEGKCYDLLALNNDMNDPRIGLILLAVGGFCFIISFSWCFVNCCRRCFECRKKSVDTEPV
jgi:hypothetical protein